MLALECAHASDAVAVLCVHFAFPDISLALGFGVTLHVLGLGVGLGLGLTPGLTAPCDAVTRCPRQRSMTSRTTTSRSSEEHGLPGQLAAGTSPPAFLDAAQACNLQQGRKQCPAQALTWAATTSCPGQSHIA